MSDRIIESRKNPFFRHLLKLSRSREIRKQAAALFSGPKQVQEVLDEFPERCAGLLLAADHHPPASATAPRIPQYRFSSPLFREIDEFATGHPILLVRVDPLPAFQNHVSLSGCTLCIPFQDPANVGATIRTAASLGVHRVVLLLEAAHPFHPKSLRASGSSIFRIPLWQGPSLEGLATRPLPMIALSPRGQDVAAYRFPPDFCLVPGMEGPGLPPALDAKATVSIPMEPGAESLNAAMAVGMVLYEWRRLRA